MNSDRTYVGAVDRDGWDAGPWDDEPDKVQWIDAATDLDCLAVRNHYGAWCGYVGVPPGHPWHGQHDDEPEVDVHGGLTFADRCMEDLPEDRGVCHVPEPGRPHDVWWLGFDCGHAFDLSPGMDARLRTLRTKHPDLQREHERLQTLAAAWRETYRGLPYVQAETAALARQAAEKTAE